MRPYPILAALALAGCATPAPVIKEVPIEVKVPVAVSCLEGSRPVEPVALKDRFPRQEWERIATEEREALIIVQALDRKIYGDKLTGATAGCN